MSAPKPRSRLRRSPAIDSEAPSSREREPATSARPVNAPFEPRAVLSSMNAPKPLIVAAKEASSMLITTSELASGTPAGLLERIDPASVSIPQERGLRSRAASSPRSTAPALRSPRAFRSPRRLHSL
jgi:hypothetical protein